MLKEKLVTFGFASLLMVTGYGCSEDAGSSEQDQIIDIPQPTPNVCNDKNEGDICGAGGSCFEEVCLSNTCTKHPLPQGTECRASAGVCDAAEVCDGINTDCPEDIKKTSDTVCRESSEECDTTEYCDGKSDTCPDDVYEENCKSPDIPPDP